MLAAHLMIGWQFDLFVGLPLAALIVLLCGPAVRRHMNKHAEGEVFLGRPVPEDARDREFKLADYFGAPVMIGKSWHDGMGVLDQGPYGSSVGYALVHDRLGTDHDFMEGERMYPVGRPFDQERDL